MYNISRINKDCFWDYNFSKDDILNIANGTDAREKNFLFTKVLLNSTEMLQDLELFSKNDIKMMLNDFKVTNFNYDYTFKRKNIAEVYFLDKDLLVDELRWTA